MTRAWKIWIVCIFVLPFVPASSAFGQCPLNAHVVGIDSKGDVETTRCRCNSGYKNEGGQCVSTILVNKYLSLIADEVSNDEAAKQAGMLPKHVEGLTKFAQDNHLLMMFRATNPASLTWIDKPNFIAKPSNIAFKTEKNGKYAGMVLDPSGQPLVIDGKRVHSDYDMQGIYKLDDGKLAKVNTDTADKPKRGEKQFIDRLNEAVFPNNPMIQHGADDAYIGIKKTWDFNKLEALRDPDDKFLVIEPNGTRRIIDGATNLKSYYALNGLDWPYSKP